MKTATSAVKIFACALAMLFLLCGVLWASEPYSFRIIKKEDTSYGSYKGQSGSQRVVYRIYLNTNSMPDKERMKATAQKIWEEGNNRRLEDLTVFMIFGKMKDFSEGAYGIANFNRSGLYNFSTNDYILQLII